MLFRPKKNTRRFSYTPYYLKEEKDSESNSDRIKFKRTRISKDRKGLPILIIILAIGVFLLIVYLPKLIK